MLGFKEIPWDGADRAFLQAYIPQGMHKKMVIKKSQMSSLPEEFQRAWRI